MLIVAGEGTYSEVFRAVDRRTGKNCVAKVLRPIDMYRVKREIKIIQDLSEGPNMLHILDMARNNSNGAIAIVTEYVNNTYYRDLFPSLDDYDVRFYMFQLLRAIEHTHKYSIFHRDIKPGNVMIDHSTKKVC